MNDRLLPALARVFFATAITCLLFFGCTPPADVTDEETDEIRSIDLADTEISEPFLTVADHLDVGGLLFAYIDLEDDIARVAGNLNQVISDIQEANPGIPPIPVDAEAIVRKAHLSGLRAIGLSSARNDGLFRNSTFLYLPEGRQGIFRVFGGEAREFAGLAYAHPDTDFFYETEYDTPALLETITEIAELVLGDAGRNTIESWTEQPIGPEGTTPGQLIEALHGRLSIAIILHPEERLQVANGGATFSKPEILVRAENTAPLLDTLLSGAEEFERTESNGRTVFKAKEALPSPFTGMKPVVMIEGENTFFSLNREFLDVSRGLNGETLATRDDFTEIIEPLGGTTGNALLFVRPNVFEEIKRSFYEALEAEADMDGSAQRAAFDHWLPEPPRPVAAVRKNRSDGILFQSDWPGSHKQTLFAGASLNPFTIGLVAAMAVPAFQRVRETSIAQTADNDARQLASAAQQYFLEKGLSEVDVQYDPETGVISGPLSDFVPSLAAGYNPFPETMTQDDDFVLGHPTLDDDRHYNAVGQRIE